MKWCRRLGVSVGTAAVALGVGSVALGDEQPATSVGQVVTMEAPASSRSVGELSISGGSPLLVASPGSPGLSSGITYAVRTSGIDVNITGRVDAAMPAGTTLAANLAAPPGANSLGPVSLGETPRTLVSAISQVETSGLDLTYRFTTNAPHAAFARTVTFSLVAGP